MPGEKAYKADQADRDQNDRSKNRLRFNRLRFSMRKIIIMPVMYWKKILGKNERGYLCDPYCPKSICKSIEKLNSTSPNKKIEIVKSAREFADKKFNLELMTKKYLKLIG